MTHNYDEFDQIVHIRRSQYQGLEEITSSFNREDWKF